jgi:predicted HicB family RNase H-like nuclease
MMKYKGYLAKADVDPDSSLIFGEVIGVRDTITFQGYTVPEAVRAFHESVDLYLQTCAEQGLVPDKTYSGAIAVRTTPKTHRSLVEIAESRGQSLNQLVGQILKHYIRTNHPEPTGNPRGRRPPKNVKGSPGYAGRQRCQEP